MRAGKSELLQFPLRCPASVLEGLLQAVADRSTENVQGDTVARNGVFEVEARLARNPTRTQKVFRELGKVRMMFRHLGVRKFPEICVDPIRRSLANKQTAIPPGNESDESAGGGWRASSEIGQRCGAAPAPGDAFVLNRAG
jgi:hypothetical protein